MRILHAPAVVGGNAWTLSRAERRLGLDSRVALAVPNAFGYRHDDLVVADGDGALARLAKLSRYAWRAARTYDAFHFNYGHTLLDFPQRGLDLLDLPLFRATGKPLVVTFQGCDVRPGVPDLSHGQRGCPDCDPRWNAGKARRARRIAKAASTIFCLNPDLLTLVPGEFLPYTAVEPSEWTPAPPREDGGPVRILHAPSNRAFKGSDVIEAAVHRLAKRRPIEYVLVEKVPHARVRALYESADIVVDQVRVGWYGGLAVEAMALGKPVLAYIREADLEFVPDDFARDLPIVRTTPESIERDLERLVDAPDERRRVGERSRRFVERHHDPTRIARRVAKAYGFWPPAEAAPPAQTF
ncbi:MAG TPA: glycosyltransferase [Candidatus Thermoplasmatota archaeon]|nr:glycosyltransferase [Candidatus Thermoplasmatota archaeon]